MFANESDSLSSRCTERTRRRILTTRLDPLRLARGTRGFSAFDAVSRYSKCVENNLLSSLFMSEFDFHSIHVLLYVIIINIIILILVLVFQDLSIQGGGFVFQIGHLIYIGIREYLRRERERERERKREKREREENERTLSLRLSCIRCLSTSAVSGSNCFPTDP